jgi:hypothetical protein
MRGTPDEGQRGTAARRAGRARALIGLAAGTVCAGAATVLTYPLWRPWCLTWGASDEEAARALSGDELMDDPDIVTTRAIGIQAPPSAIWPWIVQMGPGRAGAYTYDWVENLAGLDMHSADEILPQFQDVAVGDAWQLGTKGPVLRLAVLRDEEAMVLRSDDGNWVWAFVLVPEGAGTRLVSRNRIRQPGASRASRAFMRYAMEPGSLVMERKMLLGIKERAERMASEAATAQVTATRRHQAPSSGGSGATGSSESTPRPS